MTHKYKRADKSPEAQLAKGVKLGKLRIDTLTGEVEKRCSRCPPGDEWWPATHEFFVVDRREGVTLELGAHCRSCDADRKDKYQQRTGKPRFGGTWNTGSDWEKLFA